MSEKEMRRMIEESVNAVLMLEKQMEDIRKQMQILQKIQLQFGGMLVIVIIINHLEIKI
jgi:hypothetical protein